MYGSCDEIIEKIKDKYIIEISADIPYKNIYSKSTRIISMDTFLDERFDFYKYKYYKFVIKDINEESLIGSIDITNEPITFKNSIGENITENHIYINLIKRNSKGHKGAIKEVLYLIICKAIEVNTSIYFIATPGRTENPEKLYDYYNKFGFTRSNTSLKTRVKQYFNIPDYIKYNTRVNNLKKIVNKINNNSTCSGMLCGRGTRKRTRKINLSKY